MPTWPTRASGTSRRNPSTIPSPARSTGTTATSSRRRSPFVDSSGVSISTSLTGRPRPTSTAMMAAASYSAWRKSPWVVCRSRMTERRSARTGCSTTVRLSGTAAMLSGMAQVNVELKARDPDPGRTAERCLALGVVEHGVLRQRDTYFMARHGRLKLREGDHGTVLIAYRRPDDRQASESHYVLAPVAERDAVVEALDAALGTTVVVSKRRRLFTWEGVRIHLDEVEGLGSFIEF